MYPSVFFKHTPKVVLVHRTRYLSDEHFDGIAVGLFLFDFTRRVRIKDIVVVTAAIVIVCVTRVVVIHGQGTGIKNALLVLGRNKSVSQYID